jgi:hypothetical protein
LSPNINLSEAYNVELYRNYLHQFKVDDLDSDYSRINSILLNYAKNVSGKIYGFSVYKTNYEKEPWTNILVDKLYSYNGTLGYNLPA